jgi:glycosyltransferase involved in cell wall biosynthesis
MTAGTTLHVAYIVKRFPRLSQTFVLNEIAELHRQGVEITVVARDSPAPGERLPPGFPPVRVHHLDVPDTDVVTALRDTNVAHLHAHFATWAARTADSLSAKLGVPFSFTAHAHDIYHQDVDRASLAATIERAAFVVTVSEANRRYLDEMVTGAGRTGRVLRLYNGVDLAQLRPAPQQPAAARVVCVGRLVAKKGITFLVDACARLKATGRAVECVIVGDGEERAALQQQIAAAGLDRHVILAGAGSHRETLHMLRSATVCVLPCIVAPDGDRDGLPTVLLEALALGVPIVSTTLPGVREIVRHGESGLLVPPSDAAALADAIDAVLSSRALRARFALAGARRAHVDFNLPTNVARLRRLFSSASEGERECA